MGQLYVALVFALLLPVSSQDTISRSFGKTNPIKKVITLIQEMKDNVIKEGDADTAAYEKYKCWCEKYDKEKTLAIQKGEATIADLQAFLEEALAKEAQLKTEIADLERQIQEDQDALAEAMKVRADEEAAFQKEEADLKETRDLLNQAITVLANVQFLQKDHVAATKAATVLLQVNKLVSHMPQFQSVMRKDLFDVLNSLQEVSVAAHKHQRAATAGSFLGEAFSSKQEAATFEQEDQRPMDLPWVKTDEQKGMEAKPNDLRGAAAGAKSYNSRSGRIIGILQEMHDQTTRGLCDAQDEDLKQEIGFQQLNAVKLAEIAAAQQIKKMKEAELKDLLVRFGQAKEDLAAMEEAVAADKKFLANLKESCAMEATEFEKRTKARADEVTAISEALIILTQDEARALYKFSETTFVQLSSTRHKVSSMSQSRTSAMEHIARIAREHKNWALLSLAVRVRLDSFAKVRAAMDKMIAELRKQQQEEYEKSDECRKNLDETEDAVKVNQQTKEDLEEAHRGVVNEINTLTQEIEDLKIQINESLESLKAASESRRVEQQVYVKAITDQRLTIEILQKANDRLKEFYEEKEAKAKVALVSEDPNYAVPGAHVEDAPDAPSHYHKYSKAGEAGGVIAVMAHIINNAEVDAKQLVSSEQKAIDEYNAIVGDISASLEADRALVAEKSKQKAAAEGKKAELEERILENDQELADNVKLLAAYHTDCDYVLKYYDIRQKARAEEIDAIVQAKAILAGANFGKEEQAE